jgi:hypothetical protein
MICAVMEAAKADRTGYPEKTAQLLATRSQLQLLKYLYQTI